MASLRKLSISEGHLLETLVKSTNGLNIDPSWRDDILVESMDDGGMGSLKLVPSNASPYRKFGGTVANLEFDDTDGIKVSIALNVDQNGHLFELDIWKTDFSPLIHIPEHFV